jgi:very-short-patch-repair endonuclease
MAVNYVEWLEDDPRELTLKTVPSMAAADRFFSGLYRSPMVGFYEALRFHGFHITPQSLAGPYVVPMLLSTRMSDNPVILECDDPANPPLSLETSFRDDVLQEFGMAVIRFDLDRITEDPEGCALALIEALYSEVRNQVSYGEQKTEWLVYQAGHQRRNINQAVLDEPLPRYYWRLRLPRGWGGNRQPVSIENETRVTRRGIWTATSKRNLTPEDERKGRDWCRAYCTVNGKPPTLRNLILLYALTKFFGMNRQVLLELAAELHPEWQLPAAEQVETLNTRSRSSLKKVVGNI